MGETREVCAFCQRPIKGEPIMATLHDTGMEGLDGVERAYHDNCHWAITTFPAEHQAP